MHGTFTPTRRPALPTHARTHAHMLAVVAGVCMCTHSKPNGVWHVHTCTHNSPFAHARALAHAGGVAQFPVRWTAPEAYQQRRFTIKADVWSYGVTCMEFYTYGRTPYASLKTNADVTQALAKGARMTKPSNMSDDLYALLRECWAHRVERRPWFADIAHRMGAMA